MEKNEIERLALIRQMLVKEHKDLDPGRSTSSAMMKTEDTAKLLTAIIRQLDDVLSEYVSFS